VVNLALTHLTVFPALQNGFANISLLCRCGIGINLFTPGNPSNIRVVGDAGGERWGILFPKIDNLLSTKTFDVLCFLNFGKI